MIAVYSVDGQGTAVDLFDTDDVTALEDAGHWDNYSAPDALDQAGVDELLRDRKWRRHSDWAYDGDIGTYAIVYQIL